MINRYKGTQDLYGEKINKYKAVQKILNAKAENYGYGEIITPVFESIDVFVRTVGETSDIVKKEFYHFFDKGEREIALRPENTAPVIRCVVEDKLLYTEPMPLKFYYCGPMFRYERPQSGRYRQFYQFGCEIINTNSVYDDFEILKFVWDASKSLKVKDFVIKINNLGGFESRAAWIEDLKKYFSKYKDKLTPLSQERLEKNPTRILDDKEDGEKDFVKKAPSVEKYLSAKEQEEFKTLLGLLDDFKIKYEIDPTLVRGLDYYTNMVFEIVSKDGVSFGGGGRYGKMVKEFGGEDVSCIGFAFGLDRLVSLANIDYDQSDKIAVVFASFDQKNDSKVLDYIYDCRDLGINTVGKFNFGKVASVFKFAERKNIKYVALVGNNEIKGKYITLKDVVKEKQKKVSFDQLVKIVTKK